MDLESFYKSNKISPYNSFYRALHSIFFPFLTLSRQPNRGKMELEKFEPIFGEPKAELANSTSGAVRRHLFHVHAPDSSHLMIHVTDFHSSTWGAKRSVFELDDMRDEIGVGGSWSEFIDYVVACIKSGDVKLVLKESSSADGIANAKLVAQKSKGMPLISISLTKLEGSAASEAMESLSLELFKAFKCMQYLFIKEQERSSELTKAISAEMERNETIQDQMLHSKKQKLQKMNFSLKTDSSASLINNGLQDSPDKKAARSPISAKVANRVIPAYRRAKVRGALLQGIEDDKDN